MMKSDWKDLFEKAGVRKGSRVLFQWGGCQVETAGGLVTVVEALMETVSEAGTIIMPAFSRDSLDPFCRGQIPCPFEMAGQFRHSLHGYEARISGTDEMSLTLLRMGGARTEHPSRSYVVWGTYDAAWLKQPLDYPQSHCLEIFGQSMDVNLLVGMRPQESLLVGALCHAAGRDVSYVQKGVFYRPRRNLARTWLMSRTEPEVLSEALELVRLQLVDCQLEDVYALQLYTSVDKTVEVWKRAAQ